MARRLIAGGSAAVLVALVAGVGYLSTRAPRLPLGRAGVEVPSDQASRRSAVARQALERAKLELDVLRFRARVDSLLAAAPPADTTTLAVLVDAEGWRGSAEGERVASAVRATWSEAGLGATKVAVGVVVIDRGTARRWGYALDLRGGEPTRLFVLPDSLAPSTCLALVVAPYLKIRAPELRAKTKEWFGPCAYYARFGIPGERVRHWLAARGFDVTLALDWTGDGRDAPLELPWLSFADPSTPWYWRIRYMMPPSAVGCLAGRAPRCRAAISEGDGEGPAAPAAIVPVSDNSWNFTRQRLVGGDHFLGAVLRHAGARRFTEFWRSPLPVDSSLTLALHQPAPEWTAGWQGRITVAPRFGPGLRPRDLVAAIILSALALAAVLRASARREVA